MFFYCTILFMYFKAPLREAARHDTALRGGLVDASSNGSPFGNSLGSRNRPLFPVEKTKSTIRKQPSAVRLLHLYRATNCIAVFLANDRPASAIPSLSRLHTEMPPGPNAGMQKAPAGVFHPSGACPTSRGFPRRSL